MNEERRANSRSRGTPKSSEPLVRAVSPRGGAADTAASPSPSSALGHLPAPASQRRVSGLKKVPRRFPEGSQEAPRGPLEGLKEVPASQPTTCRRLRALPPPPARPPTSDGPCAMAPLASTNACSQLQA